MLRVICRSIFNFPGVVVHELSHEFLCKVFNVRVIKVCYYNFRESSGYVLHEAPKYLYQEILIATAPFLLNSLIGAIIATKFMINSTFEISNLDNLDWRHFVGIWLSISIAKCAIPSNTDAKSILHHISDSNANFIFKILARIIVTPIVILIYLGNLGSSWFKFDWLYGVCVFLIGPLMISKFIYIIEPFIIYNLDLIKQLNL